MLRVEAGLCCDPATAGPGKTDLLWDRAASAQNRSWSHRLSLCAENFTRLGDEQLGGWCKLECRSNLPVRELTVSHF